MVKKYKTYKPNTFDNVLIEFDAIAAGAMSGLGWAAVLAAQYGPTVPAWDQSAYQERKQWHRDRIKWNEESITGSARVTYGSAFAGRATYNPYAGKVGSVPDKPIPSKPGYHYVDTALPYIMKPSPLWPE